MRTPSAAQDESDVTATQRLQGDGARQCVILCIEDDRECASLIQEELEERGYSVVVAHDGREGLAMLHEGRVDLVLADVNMPRMSGFELLARLNEEASDFPAPFIFVTGLSDHESELAGRALGADDFVRKPIDFDILQTIIEARLAGVARLRVKRSCSEPLTERESEALMWAARGKTRDEISEIMKVAKRTVEFHLDNARGKLGVASRVEAAVKATVLGLIEP